MIAMDIAGNCSHSVKENANAKGAKTPSKTPRKGKTVEASALQQWAQPTTFNRLAFFSWRFLAPLRPWRSHLMMTRVAESASGHHNDFDAAVLGHVSASGTGVAETAG